MSASGHRHLLFWTGAATVTVAGVGLTAIPMSADEPWQLMVRHGGTAAFAIGVISLAWMRLVTHLQAGAGKQSARYEAMLQKAPDGIIGVNQQGMIIFANAQAHALFGEDGALVGQPVERFVPVHARAGHAAHREEFARSPEPRQMGSLQHMQLQRKDGTLLPVDISLSAVPDEDGTIVLAFIRDVSLQRSLWDDLTRVKGHLEQELLQRRQLRALSELLQTMRSRDEVRSVLNLHLEHMFPGTSGAVFLFAGSGDPAEPLVDWGPSQTAAREFFVDDCWAVRLGRPHGTSQVPEAFPCPHVGRGSSVPPYLCVPLIADGDTLGVFHVQVDPHIGELPAGPGADDFGLPEAKRQWAMAVAERLSLPLANLKLRETLQNQSIRDPLTGAFNRRYLEEALARELARATRGTYPVSVVMLDLDHFKQLNDVFGHAAGDAVLRRFVEFATDQLRAEDILCRYGGEEFAIVMPGSKLSATMARLEQMRVDWEALTIDLRRRGQAATTFSAGVSATQNGLAPGDRLLKAADRALYEAKARGRNCVLEGEGVDAPVRVLNADR